MLTDKLFSFHISDILKDSNYSLTQFDDTAIEAFTAMVVLKEVEGKQVSYVKCFA